jgi:hypothetical protein
MKIEYLKGGEISEKSIHKLVMEYAQEHPTLKKYFKLMLHMPNEGKRTWHYGKLMKALGMRKGTVDLFIAVPKHGFGGAWLELKSEHGKLKKDQQEFLNDMSEQNFFTCVTWSVQEAIDKIEWYLLKN